MLLIVGALVVLGSVAGGYLMEGGHPLVLNQPAEFLIIGGSAAGSLLIGTPPSVVKQLIGQIAKLFGKGTTKSDYIDLLAMLYQVFKLAQQSGVMALEAHFEAPEKSSILSKYPQFLARHHAVDFLADSIKVIIIGGVGAHDLETLMDLDLEVRHHEVIKPAATLGKIADALPGLGIVAAVLGVVITMGAIDGPPAEIGHKVGAALVGTFLGILMSYGFTQPLATNLEQRAAQDGCYEQSIKAGVLAMYKGFPPMVAIEFARRVLPDEIRPTFDETEKLCKGVKSEKAAA
jgi:chemotaxis protein MotA